MSDTLKEELRWMSQGTVNPRAAAQALERIKALEARAKRAEAALRLWEAALRAAKVLCDNINEFGHITDGELYDQLDITIRAALEAKP